MVRFGCSGFAVPTTRYFRDYDLLEVSETFLGIPGPAMVRRWKREGGEGFLFTAVAPREVAHEAFEFTDAARELWRAFLAVSDDLDARALVVLSAPEAVYSKAQRAAAHALLAELCASTPRPIVWEAPATWDAKDADAVAKDTTAIVVRDPAKRTAVTKGPLAYYRLPGPAGHRSRYEDPMLEQAAAVIRETGADDTFVVCANVDMNADVKRLQKLVEG